MDYALTTTPQQGHASPVQNLYDPTWPPAVSAELRRRLDLRSWAEASPRAKAFVRGQVLARTADGLVAFAQDWAWTFDPRAKAPASKHLPWLQWAKQEQLLRWLYALEEGSEDGVIDKSRDTGVTWAVCIYSVWRWLATPAWVGSFGSRKRELLDRLDDSKSLFWKLEYIIDQLPPWLLPAGFALKEHRHFARIVNPASGALLAGEAGADMGRGGRSSFYFLDEFGKMPGAASVQMAVSDNSSCIVYASTATPADTVFAQLVAAGAIEHFRITWQDDPRKLPAWRDDYLRKYGQMSCALEVDCDYTGGSDDSFLPATWVQAAVGFNLAAHGVEPDGPCCGGMDPGGGTAESVYVVRDGPLVERLEAWTSPDIVEAAHRAADMGTADGIEDLRYDCIGIGASVGGTIERREGDAAAQFECVAVNVGLPCTDTYYPDDDREPASERFANLKAELWWGLRLRLHHTWRVAEHGEQPDYDLLISLPDDAKLAAQLSTPKMEHSAKGRIRVEPKASLARRGVPSPDRADALVLAFADVVGHHVPHIGRL